MINRRSFFSGLVAAVAAPLVVKAEMLMPLRGVKLLPDIDIPSWCPPGWVPADGRLVSKFQFPELHKWFAKTREYGAHGSENFRLPDMRGMVGMTGYSGYETLEVQFATRPNVQIISVGDMRWPNGRLSPPGIISSLFIRDEDVNRNQFCAELRRSVQPRTHEMLDAGLSSLIQDNPIAAPGALQGA